MESSKFYSLTRFINRTDSFYINKKKTLIHLLKKYYFYIIIITISLIIKIIINIYLSNILIFNDLLVSIIDYINLIKVIYIKFFKASCTNNKYYESNFSFKIDVIIYMVVIYIIWLVQLWKLIFCIKYYEINTFFNSNILYILLFFIILKIFKYYMLSEFKMFKFFVKKYFLKIFGLKENSWNNQEIYFLKDQVPAKKILKIFKKDIEYGILFFLISFLLFLFPNFKYMDILLSFFPFFYLLNQILLGFECIFYILIENTPFDIPENEQIKRNLLYIYGVTKVKEFKLSMLSLTHSEIKAKIKIKVI